MQGLVMAALLTMAVGAHTDTTLSVSSGTQLELENYAGSIEVATWGKNAVRIEAEHGRRAEIEVSREAGTLSISVETSMGAPTSADFKLTVPAWMNMKLSGVYCDISVAGTKGTVEAETVQGDVEVNGGEGHLSVQSVQGSVKVTGASGKIEVSSVNEGVVIDHVSGDVTAESVNGKVEVRDAKLASLEASTVNGTLVYEGSFEKNGRYELSTHNGSVYVAIPANADVNVEATTYSGSFESTFPIEKDRESTKRSKRYTLRLGSGSAELTVESFQGSIVLHRPGEKVTGESDKDEDDEDSGAAKTKIKPHSKPGKHDSAKDEDSDDSDDGN
jgi:DUF4097 and DUF4098 domain-containing protein YvlB